MYSIWYRQKGAQSDAHAILIFSDLKFRANPKVTTGKNDESPLHYVHFVKYDDAVSFYDAVSDTIRRRGGNRGIFTEEGVDTVAYFGGNHGSRV